MAGEGNVPTATGVAGKSVASGADAVNAGAKGAATDAGALPPGAAAGEEGAGAAVVTLVPTSGSDEMGVARVALGAEQATPKTTNAVKAMTIATARTLEGPIRIVQAYSFLSRFTL